VHWSVVCDYSNSYCFKDSLEKKLSILSLRRSHLCRWTRRLFLRSDSELLCHIVSAVNGGRCCNWVCRFCCVVVHHDNGQAATGNKSDGWGEFDLRCYGPKGFFIESQDVWDTLLFCDSVHLFCCVCMTPANLNSFELLKMSCQSYLFYSNISYFIFSF